MMDGGLRKLFRQHIPNAHWVAIESPLTGAGIPDSNCCFEGVEVWIEMKATSKWRVRMRGPQVAWLEQRARNGGRVFIAVRRWHTVKNDDQLWLLRPAAARLLMTMGLDALPAEAVAGMWRCGPSRWDWMQVRALLRTTI